MTGARPHQEDIRIQMSPPIPLPPISNGRLGRGGDGKNGSQHNHVQIARHVDVRGAHAPFFALEDDEGHSGRTPKVSEEGGEGDDGKNGMLLPPRPVEGILGVCRGLRHQHGVAIPCQLQGADVALLQMRGARVEQHGVGLMADLLFVDVSTDRGVDVVDRVQVGRGQVLLVRHDGCLCTLYDRRSSCLEDEE